MKNVFIYLKLLIVFFLFFLVLFVVIQFMKPTEDKSETAFDQIDQLIDSVKIRSLKVQSYDSIPSITSEPEQILMPLPSLTEVEIEPQKEPHKQGPFADSPALKVQESFKVEPPMKAIGKDWLAGKTSNNFTMPVSEGRNLEIKVERFEAIGQEGGEFIGNVVGAPGSKVRLSYRGSAEAGFIDIPSEGRSYRILPGKDGEIIVQDRNPYMEPKSNSGFPPSDAVLPPIPDFIPPPPPDEILELIMQVKTPILP